MKCQYQYTIKKIEYNLNLGEDFVFMGDDPCSICNSTKHGVRHGGFAVNFSAVFPKPYDISICESCAAINFVVI